MLLRTMLSREIRMLDCVPMAKHRARLREWKEIWGAGQGWVVFQMWMPLRT
jgi:hypothetical protein